MSRWDRGSSITGKIQTLLLFCAFFFLLLPSLGPPVAKVFALQTFETSYMGTSHHETNVLSIGPFGFCSSKSGCSKAEVGYDLAVMLKKATSATTVDAKVVEVATKTFFIIPIAAGIALIGFIISASGNHIGSAIWSAVCGVIVSATSAVATGLVNGTLAIASQSFETKNDSFSKIGPGRWMIAVACALSSFCWILGIVECCLARGHQKRSKGVEYVPVGVVPAGHQTMGYGQTQSLIANQAPVAGGNNYSDPFADPTATPAPTKN